MPRYRMTTELSDEEYEPYVPKTIKKKTDEERFGKQTIPGLGLYTVPKMRTDAERAAMMEEDEELAAHVPLSSRKWYRDSLATADLCLVEAASLADPNASRATPRRSRVRHIDYDQLQVQYEQAKPAESLYGFSKKERSVEETLKQVREEKAAAKAARSERMRREWIGSAPKAAISAPSEKDACLYSINDYLEVQKAQEAEMEAEMEKAFTNHKPFKTAKQIRAEKYGVDEDEEEILNAKINIPRRKQHEIGTCVDELFDRHKSLVTSVLERRTDKIRRARAVRKEGDDDEMEELLNVNVRSPKWLAQASSPSGLYEDQFKKRLPLKLDTLEDLLNYNPHGQVECTTSAEDEEDLARLAPKNYKTFENPNFLRSNFRHLYSDPLSTVADDKYKKLMKDVSYTTAQFPPSRAVADEDE